MSDPQAAGAIDWEYRNNWHHLPPSWLSSGRSCPLGARSAKPTWRSTAAILLKHRDTLRGDGTVFLSAAVEAYRHICRGVMECRPQLRERAAALFAATLEPGRDLAAWEAGDYDEQGAYIETFTGQSPAAAAITPADVFRLADEMGLP